MTESKELRTPQSNTTPEVGENIEKQKEVNSYAIGFNNISIQYARVSESHGTKELAIKHLTELANSFETYKKTPQGKALIEESVHYNGLTTNPEVMIMQGTEKNIHDAQILLEGTDKNAILGIINETVIDNSGEEDISLERGDYPLLMFLPSEYKTNTQTITKETIQAANEVSTLNDINEFLAGKRYYMPDFTNDDFKNNPELITKALSKKDAIYDIYERGDSDMEGLSKNPNFIKVINTIISKDPKDGKFFGEAQKNIWFSEGGLNFEKTKTLLCIVKYKEKNQQNFIDMMNATEKGNGKKVCDIYEKYFIGTEIGDQIRGSFFNSLNSHIQTGINDVLENLSNRGNNRKNGLCDTLIQCNPYDKVSTLNSFSYIPREYFNIFLSHLPQIDESFSTKNISIGENIFDSLNIDNYYKAQFFYGLQQLPISGDDTGLCFQMTEYYAGKMNISKQKADIESQKDTKDIFNIIKETFPDDLELQKQKNYAFINFLKDAINKKGEYIYNSNILVEKLSKIFTAIDSPEAKIMQEKIKNSKDGQAIFQILAQGYKELENQQQNGLKNDGFQIGKWEEFKKKNRKESNDILQKLDKEINIEEKIKLLKAFIDPNIKIPEDSKERKKFIENIVRKLGDLTQTNIAVQSTFNPANAQDFSSYWKGEITLATFNTKIQERETKREAEEQQKQETKEKTKSHSDTDRAYDFHTQVQNNFSKIPTGEIITTYMDNTLFKIRKDTKDGQSTVLWNGMEISGVDMSDTKSMKENINQVMDSMRFLKENGLQVFGESIPKIIDAVNNRPERNGKERINLSDGINPEEQKELLETIGQVLDIGTSHKGLDTLKKDFYVTSLQSGGLLGRLQKKGYAKNDVIDIFAITESIKQSI